MLLSRSPYRQGLQSSHPRRRVLFAAKSYARSYNAAEPSGRIALARFKKFEFGPMTIIVGLFLLSILLSCLYLMHFNRVATSGYDWRRLEADRAHLLNEYELRDMRLAQVKALSTIVGQDSIHSMHKANSVIFVRRDSDIASR